MSEAASEHRARGTEHVAGRTVGCAVLTISDTRTAANDQSGDLIAQALRDAGHQVAQRALVPDEPERIEATLRAWIAVPHVQVIVSTGGTGLARRDRTIEVVRGLLSVELEGFGELFRMLSWQQVQAAAMLSRAAAGMVAREGQSDAFIFALPGSSSAVRLAMEALIVPQIPHLIWLRRSQGQPT